MDARINDQMMHDGFVPWPSLKSALSFISLRAVAMAAKYMAV